MRQVTGKKSPVVTHVSEMMDFAVILAHENASPVLSGGLGRMHPPGQVHVRQLMDLRLPQFP